MTYKFLQDDSDLAETPLSQFDTLVRDFFEFLMNEPKQDHYQALGSDQDVKVKQAFQAKAKKAYKKACTAINTTDDDTKHNSWRDIFGKNFPKKDAENLVAKDAISYTDNEEYIEDKYPVLIQGYVDIDCIVRANGFRDRYLSEILNDNESVHRVRSLDFFIRDTNVEEPYSVKWKVKNVGAIAERKNCLRGQIIDPNTRNNGRHESSDFARPHYVECYIIKDGYVVAKNRIDVPII